jgi:hypothetical protein
MIGPKERYLKTIRTIDDMERKVVSFVVKACADFTMRKVNV